MLDRRHCCPFWGNGFPNTCSSPGHFASFFFQIYPGQQYLPGSQYTPSATQYAPGPGQPPAPSSFPGHRLPLQQGVGQPLSTSGPSGLHYKVGLAPLGPAAALSGPWARCCGTQTDLEQPRLAWEWGCVRLG